MRTLILLLLGFPPLSTNAQDIKYPGHRHNLKETAREAYGVCVAEFENLGLADVGSPGAQFCFNAVLKVRRGILPADFRTASCTYSVQFSPLKSKEIAPVLGRPYLMLGRINRGVFSITKMVEPTPENIAIVENVLRERGIEITTDTQSQPARPEAPSQMVQTAEATPAITTPKEVPPSATPWSIIVALIVAALAVAWSLLKRR
jgi:hypothetical protein